MDWFKIERFVVCRMIAYIVARVTEFTVNTKANFYFIDLQLKYHKLIDLLNNLRIISTVS
jgi:pyruvate carboxylase